MAWETRTEWNLATNPTLTDPYGTITVPDIQVNRAAIPRPASGNVWGVAWGTGGAGATAYMYQLLKATWTTAPTAGSRRIRSNASTGESVIPVTPGETITISADVASNRHARIVIDFTLGTTWVTQGPNSWGAVSADVANPSRIAWSGAVPAGVDRAVVLVEILTPGVGDWIAAGRLQVEPGSVATDYFDGDSVSLDPAQVYGWTGTPNASTSYIRHAAAASGTANRPRALGNVNVAISHLAGTYVMADASAEAATIWIPKGSANGWMAFPGTTGDASGTAMSRLGMSPGKTYAAGVLYSQTGPLGFGPPAGLKAFRRNAAGIQSSIYGNVPEDVEQTDTPLFVSFTIDPTDTDMSLIYQANTSASNNVIRLRNLIICEGDTQAEALEKVQTYFDGSSPGFTFNDQYVKPRWEGTPFQSKSFFTWKSWVPDPPPTIQWDDKTKMSFQAGLDRGVLYLQDGTTVPWNGLTSVNTYDEANAEVESYYVDGLKLLDVSGYGEFEADLSAFTTPKEFDRCVGLGEIKQGISVAGQQRESFGLSYRTLVGDSQKGLRRGYKIHLIYGATALSESESHETLSDDPAAMSLSWKLKTVAQHIPGRAPSAHLIIDTRYMYSSSVAALEAVLYGADQPPRLPTPTEVLDIVEAGSGLRVIDNGDGTFSVESDIPNAIKEISSTEFEIDWETVETTVDTYTVKSF